MSANKNKVIQLFPNEIDKSNKFDKRSEYGREIPSNLLIKQTTEVQANYIHGKTTILKSVVKVTIKN